jgi:hypothetical protein
MAKSRAVNAPERRLWPFGPRLSIIWAFVLLIGLSILVATLRTTMGWPSDNAENVVLIAVLVLSLLPILLPLLDIIIDRGAVIEYGGVKIDFSQVRPLGMPGITVPVNIGVRGEAVNDSSTTQILDALQQATTSELVVVDLEEGHAWWETRLLVLLAGAVRLGRPKRIVFVGTEAGRPQRFQGWASASDLLRLLASARPQYQRSLAAAHAAAHQWALVEPLNPNSAPPPLPLTSPGSLATSHPWMAFDYATGLPKDFFAEQVLAADLGQEIETKEGPTSISLVRLDEIFRPVLHKDFVEQSWPSDSQLSAFFAGDTEYIALTNQGQYAALVSRLAVLNDMLRSITA